jgi:hypothetical protein
MKPALLILCLALSACTEPMLSAEMEFNKAGVSVKPTLSGNVGDATISVEPN